MSVKTAMSLKGDHKALTALRFASVLGAFWSSNLSRFHSGHTYAGASEIGVNQS